MKARLAEDKSAAVPVQATQAGEGRARWAWTEPMVWTERMLTALEQGVKGGKWFSLIDKVYRLTTLLISKSFHTVAIAPGFVMSGSS